MIISEISEISGTRESEESIRKWFTVKGHYNNFSFYNGVPIATAADEKRNVVLIVINH